jgi:hypothetical protein
VTEEATKSRALRRNLALWFALATVLGIVEGYLAAKGWRGYDLLFMIVLSVSAIAFFGTGRRALPALAAGAVWYVLVLCAAWYLIKYS